ncbi:putative ABC transporter permease [Candidatus Saccharibacteria bacterium]|nr:putative ABC transporter permease [Candidatus Saccharibacteria bacterium]MCL1963269.1 putative ABC transporter permease [Candidatus Saccharibacteria bacterium]
MRKTEAEVENLKRAQGAVAAKRSRSQYFMKLYICFWGFAVAGVIGEAIWGFINYNIRGSYGFYPMAPTFMPLAPPYGIGAVALVLIVCPMVKKFKRMNIFATYLVSAAVLALVELTSALLITAVLGKNPFWSYKYEPYNFYGMIELKNSLLFGVVGVVFVYLIYPRARKIFKRVPEKVMKQIFWFTFVTYILDLGFAIYNILGHHVKL